MAEHQLRELLDSAIAEVAPRAVDPVADVLRRDRRRRHRAMVASAAALVLLATGGVEAVARFTGEEHRGHVAASASPSEPDVAVQRGPALPRVVGQEVIAGGLVVPIPPGWQVNDGKSIYCDVRPRTVAVGFDPVPADTGKYCDPKPFMTVIAAQLPYSLTGPLPRTDVRQMTLPGGQPAWLTATEGVKPLGQRPYNVGSLYLPWSGASLKISLDRADFAKIFPTVRTRPVKPSALALPEDAAGAMMIGPTGSDRPTNVTPRVTDSAVLAQVLDRLGDLSDVVPNDRACATADMPTATLSLTTATLPAAIVITLSDHCAQATSSLGGRVNVPPGFADDLWRLLGGDGTVEATR